MHDSNDLITLFEHCFGQKYHTQLLGGADEPLYEPATDKQPALIHFRADYFSSALHEIAHWCIAGSERRKQTDYGYWYVEDGRDEQQQRAFYQAEVKPQALEWYFSVACNYDFSVSVDNLEGLSAGWLDWEQQAREIDNFKQDCVAQIEQWIVAPDSMPARGKVFAAELLKKYRHGQAIQNKDFKTKAVIG
jgi:elongation factor P hydroxylase